MLSQMSVGHLFRSVVRASIPFALVTVLGLCCAFWRKALVFSLPSSHWTTISRDLLNDRMGWLVLKWIQNLFVDTGKCWQFLLVLGYGSWCGKIWDHLAIFSGTFSLGIWLYRTASASLRKLRFSYYSVSGKTSMQAEFRHVSWHGGI